MSAWLIVESSVDGWVDVLNLEKVVGLQVIQKLDTRIEVSIVTQESEEPWRYWLENLEEFEKLINVLPSANELGWIYIVDGWVQTWRGKLKILQSVEEGNQ